MAAPAAVLHVMVTANTAQATAALARVDKQLKGTAASGAAATGAAGMFGKVAKGAAVGGALALAYGLGKSVMASAKFDDAMRNVNSIARLNEKQFGNLKQSVLDLVPTVNQGPTKLAEGMYELVSSGFDATESLHIIEASARAASAGLTTTEVSTKAVAAVLNAYKRPASQAGAISDDLFQIVDSGVITFEELASSLGDVLPFSAALSVGLKQVGGAIATMTKAGISPEETMTRIKAVMSSMVKPSVALRDAIQRLGYESGEAMVQQEGLQGALDLLAKSTGGSKAELAALFPNIRAMAGVLALTGKNSKGANADLGKFKDTAGRTNEVMEEQSKSLGFQWQQFTNNVEAAGVAVGDVFRPALTEALNAINDVFAGTGKLGGALKTGLGAAIGVVGSALENVMLGPLGNFLTRGVSMVRSIVDKVKGIAGRGAQIAVSVGGDAVAAARNLWAKVKGVVSRGISFVLSLPGAAVGLARSLWAKVRAALVRGIQFLVNLPAVGTLVSKAESIWNAVKNAVDDVITISIDIPTPKMPSIPGLAKGTDNWGGGAAIVGEKGPELVYLSKGSQVLTASETRSLLSAGIPGFAKGKKKPHAKPQGNRWEAALAAAELTAGTADDISAISDLIGYWSRQAKKFSKPVKMAGKRGKAMDWGQLTNARQQIKSYRDMLADLTGGASATDADSGLIDLLRSQLATANLRYAVSQAQGAVLRSTPYVGSFAGGGMVPGPVGAPALAVVHGGEAIGQPGNVLVIVEDGAVDARKIRVIAGEEAERFNRRGGRAVGRTPGRAGAL